MSWFPWSESIKKRVCRYLLQHYLGHFLQQKLQYDQLSVDLYNGAGCVQNVKLDVFAINETVQKANVPIEILDGSVRSISVSIPWKNLFSESCVIEVRGICLTIQPKYMADTDLTDMTDSFCNSLKNMTTSMQVAQECLSDPEKKEAETQMFEGLEIFAQTIESIFRRIKVKFGDITLCFEHLASSATVGVGLQLNIKHFEYFDEDSDKANENAAQNQGKGAPVFENVAFSCKQFRVSGVDLSVYQFLGNKSSTDLQQSNHCVNESIMINPILIAQVFGEQQVKIRIKQNEQLSGPKVDGELYLGDCAALLTPKQLRLLMDFIDGFTTPSSNESNYNVDSFPNSVSPPFPNKPPDNKREVLNQKEELSSFVRDYNSTEFTAVDSSIGKPKVVQFYPLPDDEIFSRNAFKPTVDKVDTIGDAKTALHRTIKKSSSSNGSDFGHSDVLRLQIKVVALSLTVLHVDPTEVGNKASNVASSFSEDANDSSVDGDAHTYLFRLVKNYFKDIRKAFELYGLIDLFGRRELFINAGRKHDHLRILAGPLHVECERQTSFQKSIVSSTKLNTSVGNAELLECLYNADNSSVTKLSDCIELLTFPSLFEGTFHSMHASAGSSQCFKLSLEVLDTIEMLHISIQLDLRDCKSEVDISIVDRVSDLLYCFDVNSKVPASTTVSGNYSTITCNALYENDNALFQKVLDESETKCNKIEFDLNSSQISIDFRFPIPDLRPELQRRPWFQRMLRDEVLHLVIKDLECHTSVSMGNEQSRLSEDAKLVKLRFREMSASYSDEPNTNPKLFLQTYQTESESDYDWPFVQINFHEHKQASQLYVNDDSKGLIEDSTLHFSPHGTWETEHDSIPLFNSYYEPSVSQMPSPFSQRKVIHNNEEMILPGEEEEIQEFMEHASSSAKLDIMLKFPVVNIALPSKSFIESLYNRFGNDLLLWEPAAPQPSIPPNTEMHSIPARLDIESQFFSTNDHFFQSTDSKSGMQGSFMTEDDESNISFMSKNNTPVHKSIEKNQSLLSLSLSINQGSLSLCSSVKSNDEDSQTGQIYMDLESGSLFIVSQYLGNPNLDFICVQVQSCSLYHKIGLLAVPVLDEKTKATNVPSYLNSIIYPVNKGVISAFESRNLNPTSSASNMVTVVLKLELEEQRSMKRCVVAALLNGLTLRHQFLPVGNSFLEQMVEVFDLEDTPVLGYEPPTFVTEIHFHVNDCAVDYKPIHLNTRAVATISSFALSSNVVADSPLSNLQIVMDNVNVHLSDNCSAMYVDLRQNFVNILSIALLELCLKLSSQPGTNKSKIPDLELIVSNSHIRMWTCADSCALLAALLRYIAEDGDMVLSHASEGETSTFNGEDKDESDDESLMPTNAPPAKEANDTASFEEHLKDLLADAVVELNLNQTNSGFNHGDKRPDGKAALSDQYEEDFRSLSDFVMEGDDDDFCIIDDVNPQSSKNFDPKIEYLVEDKIVVIDNYFAPVVGRGDQLKPPDHFPIPVMRYKVRELSLSWYIFGGNDFQRKENSSKTCKDKDSYEMYAKLPTELAKRSPLHLDKKPGGVNRDYKVLMEFHMTKARFQQEVYSPEHMYASRTVFAVANFEIHDRLQSSQINKFLYHFHNVSSPKQSNADMLLVKALLVRAEKHKDPECKLRISLQPLRLNIDQDSLTFLTEYFGGLASSVNDDVNFPFDDGSTYGTAPSTFAEPRLEIKHHFDSHSLEIDNLKSDTDSSNVIRPLFFNEFIFSPAVPIRLDYHGKRIDIEQGKLAGLLMGLGQLNCSQLKLQKIVHRHGLLGFDKLINFTLNEWAADIRNNQLPSILGGVGPMHSFVQFFQGFRDLVWLPMEQYRRDGRIVRGLQRGTSSFGTSTSMAVLELTNRLVSLVQTTAETACDIISPADFHRSRERYLNSWRGLEKQARRRRQPTDLREGFNNAVSLVHHGVTDTAISIARVAQKEHERKGLPGAVGGVIRHIPLTLVRPVAIASEATSNVLSGMRNQILPDARKEDEDKWRDSANGS